VSGSIAQSCASANRTCVEDSTAARCGSCLDGYLDEAGTCRAVKSCDAAGCAATHLGCTPPGPHSDAACTGCARGYLASGGACVPANCVALQAECEAQNRLCSTLPGGGAACETCKAGYVADAVGPACRLPYTCATLPASCPGGQVCVPGTGSSDAFCRDAACPPCNGPGEGGVWPALTQAGRCICRTLPGFFYTVSGSVGTYPCDADADGWTRVSAWYSIASADPALRENARCDLRRVEGFRLHNEQGQWKHYTLGELVPLYETIRNDDQARLDQVSPPGAGSPEVPLYGARYGPARALRAVELNSLTKACAGERADHNDNRLSDISEWGRPPVGQAPVSAGAFPAELLHAFELYTRYSYFVELHGGWYEAGPGGAPGTYHLAEKDRSGSSFPLRYGREASGQVTSDYWKDCPRARDVWYSDAAPAVGLDFASASAARGWSGMTHHSQFKCVRVVDDATYAATDHESSRHVQSVATLGDPSAGAERDHLRAMVNGCFATPEAGRPVASGRNPIDPIITCVASPPAAEQVGGVFWAAVRITASSRYYRGCILQCNGFPFVCPAADPADPSPQECYHVCGDLAASEAKALGDPLRYWLRGEVPVVPTADGPVEDASSGYRLTPR
jgi:hypothetical protein